MKSILMIVSLVVAAAAAPDPLITPQAELAARQDDPALLGWVDATNGQFSDQRSCDYPATLSSSGSLAQCCASSSCVFWSSCSAGTLLASQTSLLCDQGYCNTAVLVPTIGASDGQSYLGCWATSLGETAFTLIKDIGEVPNATATPTSGSAQSSASDSSTSSEATSSPSSATGSGAFDSATQSSTGASQSSGAAAVSTVEPLIGVFGLIAVLFGML